MKKFIKEISLFAFLASIPFVIINFFQERYNNDPVHYQRQYSALLSEDVDYEGIILGTSHSTHGIRPSVLDTTGVHFYNFSLNGSNPTFNLTWYNELFLMKHNRPNYCLLEVDWFMFDDYWLERRFEKDSEYFERIFFIKSLFGRNTFNKKHLLINRFPLLKYRESILESIKLVQEDSRFPKQTYDRGYISYNTKYDSTKFKIKESKHFEPNEQKDFIKLIEQMQEQGTKLIFVMTPEFGVPMEQYLNSKTYNIIVESSKKYNIPFLNYNQELRSELNENIDFFADWGHLNDAGSLVFSRMLSEDLIPILKTKF